MKSTTRAGLITALLLTSGTAAADWSANIGWASDYYYRGIFQKQSSASAGVDYENNGFYVGAWAADVGGDIAPDGIEVDGYFGYGANLGEVSLGIGFTGYYYSGDFDDTYQEINLSAGYSFLTLDAAIGEYDFSDGATQNYQFYSLKAEHKGFWALYGTFQDDFEGDYFQMGYDTTVSEIDLGISLLFSSDELVGNENEAIIFTIGKSFDL